MYPAQHADMAEMVDALDLGSNVERRAGSTPVIGILLTVASEQKWFS